MQLLHFIVGLTIFISTCLSISSDDRVMGWNKAHGLWGKRSVPSVEQNKRTPQNWQKLNSLWGKRSAGAVPSEKPKTKQFDVDYELIDSDNDDVAVIVKRNAQWQRANGLWGRK